MGLAIGACTLWPLAEGPVTTKDFFEKPDVQVMDYIASMPQSLTQLIQSLACMRDPTAGFTKILKGVGGEPRHPKQGTNGPA